MPEEENNQQEEQAVEEQAPEAEAPAEEAAEAPAADDAPAAPEPAADAEPEEALGPKQRRKRRRSLHTGETRPSRSPEERLAERAEARRKKAAERKRWRARSRERRKAEPHDTTEQAPVVHEHARPRVRQGLVVSNKADKTITVRIEVQRAHRTYGKVVRTSSTLHAHDERNEANAGDTVRIVESRPLSRTKRWRLVEILERAR
jgi:small subunit ribosomal protein S17